MARGADEKEVVTQKILETFSNSFIYNKEIRIPINDVQIKVTLTCAKENVEAGVAGATVLAVGNGGNVFDNFKSEPIQASEEEKQLVNDLITTLGL